MNRNRYAIGAAALATIILASCGGSDGDSGNASTVSSTTSTTSSFDTADVWAQALQKSETTEPYALNNGAVVFSDTSDTTQPISITGP
jgi:hypothetical protein